MSEPDVRFGRRCQFDPVIQTILFVYFRRCFRAYTCAAARKHDCARRSTDSVVDSKLLLDQLRKHKEQIDAACCQFGAPRIRVFGSAARGEERTENDIDVLVDFLRGYDLFKQRIPLQGRLAEITGRHQDLVSEHELNRHIGSAALREAVEL